jgi:hypothetical protein
MENHPVLISTSAGPVGAMVTLPTGETKGVAVVYPGWNATRAGLNEVWTKLARSFSSVGISTVRFDYPGTGESHACRRDRWINGATEAVDWARRHLGHERLLLVSECGGILPAHAEVTRYPSGVVAVAYVLPLESAPGGAPYLRRALHRARAAVGLGRRARWICYGAPDITAGTIWPRAVLEAAALRSSDVLVDVARAVPLWVLCAPEDPATDQLNALLPRLRAGIEFELELAPPAPEGPSRFPGEQEVVDCVTAWAVGRLDRAAKPCPARGDPAALAQSPREAPAGTCAPVQAFHD